jgi:septum formation protein
MLILASQSSARKLLLAGAGITFQAMASPFDEEAEKGHLTITQPKAIAGHLALAKATALAKHHTESFVIGADQVLELNGTIFHKPKNLAEAHQQLQQLRGQTHVLHSATCVVKGNTTVFENTQSAQLAMRQFSEEFLDTYLSQLGDQAMDSPGCYKIESLGIQLFDRVEGDHSTILGLPLFPLLAFLREAKLLPA